MGELSAKSSPIYKLFLIPNIPTRLSFSAPHRVSECHDLLTGILREEWGYEGLVTTDWWNLAEHYKEVLAGNDVKMACGFPHQLEEAVEAGVLTRKDLELCAKRVLELILKLD